jgi:hypothetical protein
MVPQNLFNFTVNFPSLAHLIVAVEDTSFPKQNTELY